MANIQPESPSVLEEIVCSCGYRLHFKDADSCSLVPKDPKSKARPISIPQQVGPKGVSTEIIEHIMIELKIDSMQYLNLLATVKAKQQQAQANQTRNL
jgi:hypothetical protein